MNNIQELSFSGGTLLGYSLCGAVCLLLPLIAVMLMRKYKAASVLPVIAGAVTYLLFTRFNDIFVTLFFPRMPFSQKMLAAVETIALFEEVGRFLAMKIPLSQVSSSGSAVCLGIGHAGAECMLRAAKAFRTVGYGLRVNSIGPESFLRGKSELQAETITQNLQQYADQSFLCGLADSVQYITNFGFHIAVTLLIYRMIFVTDGRKRWLALAVLLHYAMNCIPYLASLTGSNFFARLAGIGTGTGIMLLVSRLIDGRSVIDEIRFPLADIPPA